MNHETHKKKPLYRRDQSRAGKGYEHSGLYICECGKVLKSEHHEIIVSKWNFIKKTAKESEAEE